MIRSPLSRAVAILMCGGSLTGCLVGPNYSRPATPITPAFKESVDWSPATPSDAAERLDWWTAFGDPVLNDLEGRVAGANQTVAAAEGAYRQARAVVRIDRAALFPTVSATGSVSYSKSGGAGVIGGAADGVVGGAGGSGSSYRLGLGGSWAPDFFGATRRTIEGAQASAAASAGNLANARLVAQTELALDYVQLRQQDEEARILTATSAAYADTLRITQNKYNVGVVAKSDLLSARSQLATTQAQATDLVQSRARLEHAIAVLIGQAPATLTLAPGPWRLTLPEIPSDLPSTLLQRRPDIAAAERNVAAANAQIGVQTAAYYPSVTLTGSGDTAASQLGGLFSASSFFWSVGASAAETLLDFGARRGRVAEARAVYDQSVASYRQTVLTAFAQVEDDLAAQRVLGREQASRQQAATDAAATETIARNQYNAGQVDFTNVVVAQTNALNARTAELQIEATRLATAIDLIAALGGGWRDGLPSR